LLNHVVEFIKVTFTKASTVSWRK